MRIFRFPAMSKKVRLVSGGCGLWGEDGRREECSAVQCSAVQCSAGKGGTQFAENDYLIAIAVAIWSDEGFVSEWIR